MKKIYLIFHFVSIILFIIYQIFKHDMIVFVKTNLPLGAVLIFGILDIFVYILIGFVIIASIIHAIKRRKTDKWKTIVPLMMWIFAVALVLILPKSASVEKLTYSQAAAIGKTYFLEQYGKTVSVDEVKYEEIYQYERRNIITACDGETEYVLYLDKKNRPAFDNVSAVDIRNHMDIASIKEAAYEAGLELSKHSNSMVIPSYEEKKCLVRLCTASIDRPIRKKADACYSFLSLLKDQGIAELSIEVNVPDFLLSKDGVTGVVIDQELFDASMDREQFAQKYCIFSDSIFWDKQRFENKMVELNQMGYINPYFFISQWRDSDTLEIILYYESTTDRNQNDDVFADMDERYIRLDNVDIVYMLQHSNS